jgi:hypothetical protein
MLQCGLVRSNLAFAMLAASQILNAKVADAVIKET